MSTNSLMPRFHYVVKNSKGQMLASCPSTFAYIWSNKGANHFVSADVAQRKIDAANSPKIVGKQKWVRPDYPDMSDAYVAYVD